MTVAAMNAMRTGAAADNNRVQLARQGRRAALSLRLLTLPAFLLLLLTVFLPGGWLVALSVVRDGSLSLANYSDMFDFSHYQSFKLTFGLAIGVTAACVLLGYPLAYCLSQMTSRLVYVLLAGIMFPLWTSVLVRTFAWTVLLQKRGPINTFLVDWGLTSGPLPLANNMTGTIIGMVHVMLPFMVLPLYSSMKAFDSSLSRAAASMGATPVYSFFSVFFPLSLPGLFVGSVIVFVVSLGFYVTPAVLGGGRIITWPMQIDQALIVSADWGSASALGVALVIATLVCIALLGKFGGLAKAMGL
jgi:putative spermidine/putrescine transport system permease protein/spermidine/putrescine transport system permease protein